MCAMVTSRNTSQLLPFMGICNFRFVACSINVYGQAFFSFLAVCLICVSLLHDRRPRPNIGFANGQGCPQRQRLSYSLYAYHIHLFQKDKEGVLKLSLKSQRWLYHIWNRLVGSNIRAERRVLLIKISKQTRNQRLSIFQEKNVPSDIASYSTGELSERNTIT